jgi:hypothetical protein
MLLRWYFMSLVLSLGDAFSCICWQAINQSSWIMQCCLLDMELLMALPSGWLRIHGHTTGGMMAMSLCHQRITTVGLKLTPHMSPCKNAHASLSDFFLVRVICDVLLFHDMYFVSLFSTY